MNEVDPTPITIDELSPTQRRTRIAYLLMVLAEEAGEAAKEALKMMAFGQDGEWQGKTPVDRLKVELMDFWLICRLLGRLNVPLYPTSDEFFSHERDKLARLELRFANSRKTGLIKPE